MTPSARHVSILLCTYNGARFLPELLDSLCAQTYADWSLWISDDGSTDETRALCAAFRDSNPMHTVRLIDGPGRGSAANFLALLCHPDLRSETVALSDQDDIWLPDKLARALTQLPGDGAAIYSAQSRYIDGAGQGVGQSRCPPGQPMFKTAMLQNVLAGHSMVLNAGAVALARQAGPVPVPFHDWWLTLLVLAAGGRAVLDRQALLLYRQHAGNVLGAPQGWRAGLLRARAVLGRDYRTWVTANMQALQGVAALLTPEARDVVTRFLAAPVGSGAGRLRLLWRLGLRRQGVGPTALVYLAALFGRV